jgi:hypothetical protein
MFAYGAVFVGAEKEAHVLEVGEGEPPAIARREIVRKALKHPASVSGGRRVARHFRYILPDFPVHPDEGEPGGFADGGYGAQVPAVKGIVGVLVFRCHAVRARHSRGGFFRVPRRDLSLARQAKAELCGCQFIFEKFRILTFSKGHGHGGPGRPGRVFSGGIYGLQFAGGWRTVIPRNLPEN